MSHITISVTINGEPIAATVEPRLLVCDFLRDHLGLTGTHIGCEHGVCGACTVLVDGRTARSCLMFAAQLDGAEVETVEGLLLPDGELSPLQASFRDNHGLQCGFCTPGMLMTATELLRQDGRLDREGVREAISGNLCRCTGYETIVDAILTAGRDQAEETA
ncbi:MAG: (2Fe-2S)-binding protein [Chelatococcus sp.]|nr:(2Fe-2S)-binding protein [Chelatococcus sp. HY11]MBX3540860.1 (2Fe-2S)-binding protein [Chelatococcus sp.]CAH1654349.1 Caffeine dehydrogenase subunit gamma [Hyphomicrobiales bacterium]MBS7740240.1 (2Fe-2S)-binding protein [Chelatococcus sp. HY11]MBX3544931.1 (2Fe-2S)-binding protein [Chelatococcus sp.]MCO5078519.1 (2Fe-2S)-binding protein [Chelatococcus sp.]